MTKATVKSRSGALIEIEGTPDEVVRVIAAIEQMGAVSSQREKYVINQSRKREDKKRRTASDLVVELKEEGFFEKPHGLSEIASKLEGKGYIYPITTLSGVLLSLVQQRLLGRKKLEGKWVYGK